MTREQIIQGFHKLYLQKIEEETRKRGSIGARKGGGISVDALKKIHDETIAEWCLIVVYEFQRKRIVNENAAKPAV